jgi:hypothetical protein
MSHTVSRSIFLDERSDWRNTPGITLFYFLGGVSLPTDQVATMAQWVRMFKKALRPDLDPNLWYLKGSGAWRQEGVAQELSETRPEAFRRWECWSEHIQQLSVNYAIHATLALPAKIFSDLEIKPTAQQQEAVLKESMQAVLQSLLLHNLTAVRIWIDYVEGLQREGLRYGVQTLQQIAEEHNLPVVVESVEIVPKTDLASDESHILQFVDMHIYALSRFILPSGDKPFVLADFERLPYAYLKGELAEFLAGTREKDPEHLAQRYWKIGALYHHLRHRIIKNFFWSRTLASSIVLLGRDVHYNFGRDVDMAIWQFCHPMWEQQPAPPGILIDLDEYL